MKVHILTPFSRWKNFNALKENYKDADSWTCLIDADNLNLEIFENEHISFEITHPGPVDGAICYRRVNEWIDKHMTDIDDKDWYMFMCDDDCMPEGFIRDLKNTITDLLSEKNNKHYVNAIIVNAQRGHNIPDDELTKHPTTTLDAGPNNMKTGSCTWEQAIVRGDLLKRLRFNGNNGNADGEMMEWLKDNANIHYAPYLFIQFNYLQPGRWNLN